MTPPEFDHPAWLLLALAAPLAGAWAWIRRAPTALPWSVGESPVSPLGRWREWLALALLSIALAGPRLAATRAAARALPPRLFVLDVSRSMLAADAEGARFADRFAAAVGTIAAEIAATPGRRFGVVTFAGDAELAIPPTADRAAFGELLAEIDPRRARVPGSAVASALKVVREWLSAHPDATGDRGGELVVLSDGEWDEDADARALGDELSAKGWRIEGRCFGSPDTATPLPAIAGAGEESSRAKPARLAALAQTDGAQIPQPPPEERREWTQRVLLAAGLLLLAWGHFRSGATS